MTLVVIYFLSGRILSRGLGKREEVSLKQTKDKGKRVRFMSGAVSSVSKHAAVYRSAIDYGNTRGGSGGVKNAAT